MSGRLAEMKGTACRGDEPALVDQMFGVLEAKGKGDGTTRLCSPSSRRGQRTEQRDRRQQVDERQRRRELRGVRPDGKRTVHRRSDRRQEDYVIGRRRWIWQIDVA